MTKRITITITTEWTVHGDPTEEELRHSMGELARHVPVMVVPLSNWRLTRDTLHVDLDTTGARIDYAAEIKRLRDALEGIMPFVEEDYYAECATPKFAAAMHRIQVALYPDTIRPKPEIPHE